MWTKEQSQTIDQRGKNILVSAAAGSGKTAVLVERIKKMVTEEGVAIDSMLIVTFTKAAASEMKEKIRRALCEKVRENPKLQKQLDILPRANISTFHSFALDVIRHFFYKVDLDPDFSVCDEAQSAVIREESLDELFRGYYEKFEPDFVRLLDWYASEKNDDAVRTIVRDLYTALIAMPEPFETLQEKIDQLIMDDEDFKKTDAYAFMSDAVHADLHEINKNIEKMSDMLEENELPLLRKKLEIQQTFFAELLEKAKKGETDEIYELIGKAPAIRLVATKNEKEKYGEIKGRLDVYRKRNSKLISEMRESFFSESMPQMLDSLRKTYPIAQTLQKMTMNFHEIFSRKKREKKLMDFGDIEQFCFKILKEGDASQYYENRFKHIFIDEYQDTNVIQEAIIEKIARKDNLFMVGDVKQSIYKFRLAEPEIFMDKYKKYAGGTDENSIKIDLNKNFRSDPAILQWINDRFKNIMHGYTKQVYLYPGNPCQEKLSFVPETRIIDTGEINYASEDTNESQDGAAESAKPAQDIEKNGADEAIREMKAVEIEALEVCRIIHENVGKEYETVKLVDGKKVLEKKRISFRDIVILMRAVSGNAQIYSDAMQKAGIPCYMDDSKGYFDTMEVGIFTNLLRLMDNRYRDIELLSVLRSEIFGFSTGELAEIRAWFPKGSFADAFSARAGLDAGLDDGGFGFGLAHRALRQEEGGGEEGGNDNLTDRKSVV